VFSSYEQQEISGMLCVQVWDHAFQSARHGASASAHAGHDFAFVPAAYDLIFFICVGMPGSTFSIEEVFILDSSFPFHSCSPPPVPALYAVLSPHRCDCKTVEPAECGCRFHFVRTDIKR
jgi:hypothetical protein